MIWIRAWRDRIIIVIIVVMIKGRTLWVLQIVLQNVKAIFIIKRVWKFIRLVNVVNLLIWQVYKSSIMRQEDIVMVHLIFQSDVEACHGNMVNFKTWQYTYTANLWSTYKWLVYFMKRMWLVMSIVNSWPFYKRMGQDVIKSLWIEYMHNSPLWKVWEKKMIYATSHIHGRFERNI